MVNSSIHGNKRVGIILRAFFIYKLDNSNLYIEYPLNLFGQAKNKHEPDDLIIK